MVEEAAGEVVVEEVEEVAQEVEVEVEVVQEVVEEQPSPHFRAVRQPRCGAHLTHHPRTIHASLTHCAPSLHLPALHAPSIHPHVHPPWPLLATKGVARPRRREARAHGLEPRRCTSGRDQRQAAPSL